MAASKVSPVTTALPSIFYEDPEPVEDGMQQSSIILDIGTLLKKHFRNEPEVFVSAGGFLFYDPANGNRRIAPDIYVALDVDAEGIWDNLPNYLIWEIGKPPDFVLEVASPSTASNDLGHKRDLYAQAGHYRVLAAGPHRRRPVRPTPHRRTPGGRRVPPIRTAHRRGRFYLGVQRGAEPAIPLGLGTGGPVRRPQSPDWANDRPRGGQATGVAGRTGGTGGGGGPRKGVAGGNRASAPPTAGG